MKTIKYYTRQINRRLTAMVRPKICWKPYEQDAPRVLKVEVTNVCNANCIFCGYQYDKRKKGFMPEKLYLQALAEYRKMGGKTISFVPIVGEPLIDANFIDKVKEAKSFGFTNIYTYTNGILLNKHNLMELLKSGINKLIISTAPLDKKIFERLYRSQEYDELLEGLKKLFSINREFGNPVAINILFRSDIPVKAVRCCPDYQKYIKPYLKDESTQTGVILKNYDNWGGMINQGDLSGDMAFNENIKCKLRPCKNLFNCTILWDGRVHACGCRFSNLDSSNDLIVGNLYKASLPKIWFGEKLKALRRSFGTNTLNTTCSKCLSYMPV